MMKRSAPRPLLSIREAAALMGISRRKAYTLAHADALPGLVRTPGFELMVRRAVLERWLVGDDPQAGPDEAA